MQLELLNLSVSLDGEPVCSELNLSLGTGRFGCLLGPSGSGKTTILRAIAGFVPVSGGRIEVGHRLLSEPGRTLAPEKRGIGMVFQDLALLPHQTVSENIGFGLWRMVGDARQQRIDEMLELAGLRRHAGRYPHELSGGQQQRVAVARALAPSPGLLLMDEPFSGLDAELRLNMAQQVRELVASTGTTSLMVTHDQQEALAIADQVGVVNNGRLEQWDEPQCIHDRPATRFVAGFVGDGVLLPVHVESDGSLHTEIGAVSTGAGIEAKPGELLVRPAQIRIDEASPFRALVDRAMYRGGGTIYRLRLASGRHVLAFSQCGKPYKLADTLGVRLSCPAPVLFPGEGGLSHASEQRSGA